MWPLGNARIMDRRWAVVGSAIGMAVALGVYPAHAADDPPIGPDIIVTGRGIDPEPETRGYDVVTIAQDRLAATAGNRLEDALADVAGLASFRRSDSRSANPTSQGLTLRGIGGNAASRALLILNGVPQQDPFAGWVAFPAYAPASLARVRVTRGGGSAIWGPGAETGTVELESARPAAGEPIRSALFYGSRNSVDASGAAALVRATGFAVLSASYQRGDGFLPIVADDRGPVDHAAHYAQGSIGVRGVIDMAPATELQASVSGFIDRRDRGLDFTANKSEGADASLRIVGRGRWRWSLLGYLQTRNFASRFASVNDARTVVTPTLDQYGVPATGLGGRIDIAPPALGAFTVRAGADARAVSGETRELFSYIAGAPTRRRIAGGSQRTAGSYADVTLTVGRVSADLNGRIDAWSITGGHLVERALATGVPSLDQAAPDRSGWEPTGRAGIGWRLADKLTLRAAGYRGWRLPTLNELYRPFRAGADGTAANAALRPEHLLGAEIGADWHPSPAINLSVTLFDNRLDDAIGNVTIARGPVTCAGVGAIAAGGFCRRRDNLDAISARGVEIDAGATRGAVGLRISYAYTQATVSASGAAAALNGLAPAQTPAHQGSATLAWAPRQGPAASLTARYVGAQFEDDLGSRTLRSAFTVDGTVRVPIGHGLAVEGRAENLFDATVDTGFSNAALERSHPRTLWIGVSLGR